MDRADAIARLKEHEAELKQLGVQHLDPFCSTARGDARDTLGRHGALPLGKRCRCPIVKSRFLPDRNVTYGTGSERNSTTAPG